VQCLRRENAFLGDFTVNTQIPRPKPPEGVSDAGRRVWRAIWRELPADMVLDEREQLVLRQACEIADDLARLDDMLASAGDERQVLRVLGERRQQRLSFGRLLAQLELGGEPAKTPLQRRASKAAAARWRPHNEIVARRQLG
jgi:hypothetical protein